MSTPRTRAIAVRRRRLINAVERLAETRKAGPPSTREVCDALNIGRYSTEGMTAYADLRALERRGLVRRTRFGPCYDVFWAPRGELTDDEANRLVGA